ADVCLRRYLRRDGTSGGSTGGGRWTTWNCGGRRSNASLQRQRVETGNSDWSRARRAAVIDPCILDLILQSSPQVPKGCPAAGGRGAACSRVGGSRQNALVRSGDRTSHSGARDGNKPIPRSRRRKISD